MSSSQYHTINDPHPKDYLIMISVCPVSPNILLWKICFWRWGLVVTVFSPSVRRSLTLALGDVALLVRSVVSGTRLLYPHHQLWIFTDKRDCNLQWEIVTNITTEQIEVTTVRKYFFFYIPLHFRNKRIKQGWNRLNIFATAVMNRLWGYEIIILDQLETQGSSWGLSFVLRGSLFNVNCFYWAHHYIVRLSEW